MRLEPLAETTLEAFKSYCRKHKGEVDTSFIDEEDLLSFRPGPKDPTYLMMDEEGAIRGASSLMMNLRADETRRARLRFLHSEDGSSESIGGLLEPFSALSGDIDAIYLFVPHTNPAMSNTLAQIGFEKERAVYQMVREAGVRPDATMPHGVSIRPFVSGQDELTWCTIRNSAFASLTGSKTVSNPEMVREMANSPDRIEGGMMVALFEGLPVGVICAVKELLDDEVSMKVAPIAVLPAYQGMGIGRALLRSALALSEDLGMRKAMLSVNVDNDKALSLYEKEGFRIKQGYLCMSRRVCYGSGTGSPS